MLRLSLRTLFFLTPSRSLSPYSILIARRSTSSTPHLTSPRSHSDNDPRNQKVLVCWDMRNCALPACVNPFGVAKSIRDALKSSGIKGHIDITAFAVNVPEMPDAWALTHSGIDLVEASSVDKNSTDPLDLELHMWAVENPPPGHILLIGGSSKLFPELRKAGFNTLLAFEEPVPAKLHDAATWMWNWNALVRGENLTVRYVKKPPQCRHGYFYGHCEGPLEDPSTEIAPNQTVEVLELFSRDLIKPLKYLSSFLGIPFGAS